MPHPGILSCPHQCPRLSPSFFFMLTKQRDSSGLGSTGSQRRAQDFGPAALRMCGVCGNHTADHEEPVCPDWMEPVRDHFSGLNLTRHREAEMRGLRLGPPEDRVATAPFSPTTLALRLASARPRYATPAFMAEKVRCAGQVRE